MYGLLYEIVETVEDDVDVFCVRRVVEDSIEVDDEPGEALEHVVERQERIRNDDALRGRMGDIALVPERDVLEPHDGCCAHHACEPADPLGDDRIPLVRHRRGTLLALAERLLDLAQLRAREVADLERELVERRRADRERGEQLRVPVALDDLRRRRRGLEAETLARDALDLRVDRGVLADGSRELANAHPLERACDAPTCAVELERPDGKLQAEGRRLRVDAVCAADGQRQLVFFCARDDGREYTLEPFEQQRSRLLDLQRSEEHTSELQSRDNLV